ncbi:MAG: hypothetical protein ACO25F_06480, partial [Erythrobacter sp.]
DYRRDYNRYRIGYDDYRDRDYGDRDYRDARHRGPDRGKFKCEIERGRVVAINYRGIPGLNW